MGQLYTLISGKDTILNISTCFIHRTVNHSENFINPQNEIHTQVIESLWSNFKKQIKNPKGIAGDKLESLLSELKNNECVFAGFEAVLILMRKN